MDLMITDDREIDRLQRLPDQPFPGSKVFQTLSCNFSHDARQSSDARESL